MATLVISSVLNILGEGTELCLVKSMPSAMTNRSRKPYNRTFAKRLWPSINVFFVYFRNTCSGCLYPFFRDFRNAAEPTCAPVPAGMSSNYLNERCGPVKKFIAAGACYPGVWRYARDSTSATAFLPLPECDAFHERKWDTWHVVAWVRSFAIRALIKTI